MIAILEHPMVDSIISDIVKVSFSSGMNCKETVK